MFDGQNKLVGRHFEASTKLLMKAKHVHVTSIISQCNILCILKQNKNKKLKLNDEWTSFFLGARKTPFPAKTWGKDKTIVETRSTQHGTRCQTQSVKLSE